MGVALANHGMRSAAISIESRGAAIRDRLHPWSLTYPNSWNLYQAFRASVSEGPLGLKSMPLDRRQNSPVEFRRPQTRVSELCDLDRSVHAQAASGFEFSHECNCYGAVGPHRGQR